MNGRRASTLGRARTGVRRAWMPRDVPGCFLALLGFVGVTLVSGVVSEWDDKSGKRNSPTQGTAGARMGFTSSGIAGRGSIVGDGTAKNAKVNYADGTMAQPFAFFLVATAASAATNVAFDGVDTTNRVEVEFLTTPAMGMFAGAVLSDALTTSTAHTYGCLYNGASSKLRVDGAQVASGTTGTNAMAGITVGTTFSSTAPFNGQMGGLCGYGSQVVNNPALVAIVESRLRGIFRTW